MVIKDCIRPESNDYGKVSNMEWKQQGGIEWVRNGVRMMATNSILPNTAEQKQDGVFK